MKLSALLAGACLAVAMTASPVLAAAIPWSNPSGNAPGFTWANGGNDTNLFGSPTVVGNTFLFFPSNFRAESSNGVADSANDRMEVDIFAKPGQVVNSINVQEFGDYGIAGAGASVNATGGVFATNLDTAAIKSDSLHTTPAMPQITGSGNWSGTETVSFLPNGWTKIHLVVNNDLQATSTGGQSGSTAFIEKKINPIQITIDVPEPASLALLALATPLLAIRRRSSH